MWPTTDLEMVDGDLLTVEPARVIPSLGCDLNKGKPEKKCQPQEEYSSTIVHKARCVHRCSPFSIWKYSSTVVHKAPHHLDLKEYGA